MRNGLVIGVLAVSIAAPLFAVPPQPRAGDPLPDLTSKQLQRFVAG